MSTDLVRVDQAPATLPEKMQYAKALAASGMLPAQYRNQPANLLWALEFASSLELHPMTAITGVHVIEGKPSASAALISALVRRAGHKLRVRGDDTRAVAQIIRADDPEFTYECAWTLQRAEQAGLTKKKVWREYPAAMLKARAITEVAREACEEALSGMHYTPEELGANVNAEGMPVDAEVQQLRRVQHGEPDQWATPAAAVQAAVADGPAESLTPAGRDYLHEAYAAPDAGAVRRLWQEARAAGAVPEYLDQIAEVGRALAHRPEAPGATSPRTPTEPQRQGGDEVIDGEIVPDAPTDDHAEAVAELRAFAAQVGIDDIDRDATGALGLPLEEASAHAIRGLLAQLRGNAA